ncbi:RDD family protein [Bacillus sp. V59.32b]|uniref:RDD family protein n=1 Tax=Bacillus sp. V59.32b TaxID=1758642 RepID=UPI000E3E427A|nr:RDD family protein [Bacillus sp. V59.32b]RFU66202.1 RDD family protein [Bacillus sp. V59.32b]
MNERKDSDERLEINDTVEQENAMRYQIGENKDSASEPVQTESVIKVQEPELPYAGFWMRFWAYLADIVIIGSINRIVVHPIFKALDLSDRGWFSPEAIFTAIVFYLYFTLMTKYFRQTLGKMIFGLKVVSLKEGKLSWGTIIFREFIGRFISKTTFVGYIIVGFLPKKQGLHDIFADTSVILDRR